MAKGSAKQKEEKFPRLVRAPPPSYYQRIKAGNEEKPFRKAASMERRGPEQVLGGLQMLARGWSAGVGESLNVPKTLYFFEGVGTRFYSSSEGADLSNFVRSLSMNRLSLPNADYGIVLYETSSSLYFILIDAVRRIVVREPILCYHNTPPEAEWVKVQKSIEAAVALASGDEAKGRGLYAVYDGTLRLMAPQSDTPARKTRAQGE